MNICKQIQGDLVAFIHCQLERDLYDQVRAHLRECVACDRVYAELVDVHTTLFMASPRGDDLRRRIIKSMELDKDERLFVETLERFAEIKASIFKTRRSNELVHLRELVRLVDELRQFKLARYPARHQVVEIEASAIRVARSLATTYLSSHTPANESIVLDLLRILGGLEPSAQIQGIAACLMSEKERVSHIQRLSDGFRFTVKLGNLERAGLLKVVLDTEWPKFLGILRELGASEEQLSCFNRLRNHLDEASLSASEQDPGGRPLGGRRKKGHSQG